MRKLEATVTSDCGLFKAEIERRSTGSFRITIYKWFEEWCEGYGMEAFWQPVPRMVILTDTLENAERLAREEFRSRSGQ